VRQFNAPEKEFAALDEGVDVITNANAIHKNGLRCLKARQQQVGKHDGITKLTKLTELGSGKFSKKGIDFGICRFPVCLAIFMHRLKAQ
jgi:hypothetical protein